MSKKKILAFFLCAILSSSTILSVAANQTANIDSNNKCIRGSITF